MSVTVQMARRGPAGRAINVLEMPMPLHDDEIRTRVTKEAARQRLVRHER